MEYKYARQNKEGQNASFGSDDWNWATGSRLRV